MDNKNKNNNKEYAPKERTYYKPTSEDLISKSPDGFDTILPNTVTDDIVVNNIAYQEFDYTEDMFNDEF